LILSNVYMYRVIFLMVLCWWRLMMRMTLRQIRVKRHHTASNQTATFKSHRPRHPTAHTKHLSLNVAKKKVRICSVIIIVITMTIFIWLSSQQRHCKSSLSLHDEYRNGARWPPTFGPGLLT